ncbi:MAG TPA: hypothetical protein VK811_10800 [Candidatus Acidoferrum sp.]|jgi:hypothetical protein|nr:hypothetical protein [Candidatus Acidoferrum sp.]
MVKASLGGNFLLACIFIFASAGCVGPLYWDHDFVINGKQPPKICGPCDPALQANLSTNLWAPQPFWGSAIEVGTVAMKSGGVQGWKDYHMKACAIGVALQRKFTSGPNLTIDLRLQSLTVQNVPIPLSRPSYMRVVIFLVKTSVAAAVYERTNPVIIAQGKLTWNRDGWFEIHPQKSGDVQLAPLVESNAFAQVRVR